MQPPDKKVYSFRADANALGGHLQTPFEKNIPTLAPVSLPAVGGFAMARSEAFTFDEIVTCSSAYTRVSGRENTKDGVRDGSVSILVTAVVEDLNLLEVVTARRVVAQVSIWVPGDGKPPRFSLLGSRFEGLKLAGHGRFPDVQRIGLAQAGQRDQKKNHTWVTSDLPSGQDDDKFHLQVDGFGNTGPCTVVIPGFGRITLGQLVITPDSVRLVALRADLGCPVTGGVTISCVGGGGGHDE
jgi:hypothetical protein